MSNIKLLDCTLRDGGYINDWDFGFSNVQIIINNLTKAKIDMIECGFLEDFKEYNINRSLFNNVDQIKQVIPQGQGTTEYVAMTRFGELDSKNLIDYDGKSISGIRVTFHLDEMEEAMGFCREIKQKGYKVFVQPVGTTSYSDEELLSLIEMVNILNPYSFYIVDTLGTMTKKDVHRLFYLVDHNLSPNITIGFHSHNNLQLSFSNAQELVFLQSNRTILIDSSVYGMGRGAGNLNTELIAEYINLNYEETYNISYLLEIVDDYITGVRTHFDWGYSVPYYLAAIHNCHPNYATFLINKKTLQVSSIATILNLIPKENRELYDKNLVEQLYLDFQTQWVDDKQDLERLKEEIKGRKILILVPGKSIKSFYNEINQFILQNDPIIFSVQFSPEMVEANYVFFSNRKRLSSFIMNSSYSEKKIQLITTSNAKQEYPTSEFVFNYSNLLNSYSRVKDNSTLMLLKLLEKVEVSEITLAGFDGYNINSNQNYILENMETFLDEHVLYELNKEITDYLEIYSNSIDINSITPSVYFGGNKN